MAKFSSSQFTLLFTFLLFLHGSRFSLAMSTITAMDKNQIVCTMCSSCDNPCQPIFSPPPPPSPVLCPPPLSPPPSPPSGPNCPPPPQPPVLCPPRLSPPPPPPSGPNYPPPPQRESPPPSDGILPYPASPPPPHAIPPFPTPPNPYFPVYYYSPPPPYSSSDMSNSIQLRSHQFVAFLVVSVSLLSLI